MGVAKVDWDTTYNTHNQKMGIEVMVKDCKGNVLTYLSTSRKLNSQPILAKCIALWRAIEFADELGHPCVQFEEDTQTIIKTSFQVNKFVHLEGNKVVHSLAKLCMSLDIEKIQMEKFPLSITNVIIEDKI